MALTRNDPHSFGKKASHTGIAGWSAAVLLLIIMLLTIRPAVGETPAPMLERIEQTTAFGSVAYPVLTHYPDELTRIIVNLLLIQNGKVSENIDILNKQNASGWGMEEDYEAYFDEEILSVVFSMKGALDGYTNSQAYTALNYDLPNARVFYVEDLFSDTQAAIEEMERILSETVAPSLSGYVVNEALLPLPTDTFYITRDAITFYYPADQLMMLSGYAGSASFFYYELAPWLNLEEGSVLSRIGAGNYLAVTSDSAEKIAETVSQGLLPGIPIKPGDALEDVIAAHRLFCDPDYFPNSRFFQLESGILRGILVLAEKTGGIAGVPVTGIRCDRLNLYGIQVGVTDRSVWRETLGMPEDTIVLDAFTARDFLLPAGMSDDYVYGDYRLRLYADNENLLRAVYLYR
ncbi:MAG: RsiV family protein [Clostridia bacterium]|nr:RsiV family protein [Clostridia bacterium]